MRLLVVNPYASGVTEERIADVTAALGEVEVRRTEHGGHATDLVRVHADAEAVYVFSGDGGFNEVLNGIGPDTPVGFVPGGGANVLPRALGLPGDPVLAAEQLAKGRARRISVGRVNGRRFGFSAGIGIDADAQGDAGYAAIEPHNLEARTGQLRQNITLSVMDGCSL